MQRLSAANMAYNNSSSNDVNNGHGYLNGTFGGGRMGVVPYMDHNGGAMKQPAMIQQQQLPYGQQATSPTLEHTCGSNSGRNDTTDSSVAAVSRSTSGSSGSNNNNNSSSSSCNNNDNRSNASDSSQLQQTGKEKFPFTLYRMLMDAEKNGDGNIISWTSSGKSFKVHNREVFMKRILPKYLRQTRYKSFVRQLNLWGLACVHRGPDKGGYYNNNFQRGREDLLPKIKRIICRRTHIRRKKPPVDELMAEIDDHHIHLVRDAIKKPAVEDLPRLSSLDSVTAPSASMPVGGWGSCFDVSAAMPNIEAEFMNMQPRQQQQTRLSQRQQQQHTSNQQNGWIEKLENAFNVVGRAAAANQASLRDVSPTPPAQSYQSTSAAAQQQPQQTTSYQHQPFLRQPQNSQNYQQQQQQQQQQKTGTSEYTDAVPVAPRSLSSDAVYPSNQTSLYRTT